MSRLALPSRCHGTVSRFSVEDSRLLGSLPLRDEPGLHRLGPLAEKWKGEAKSSEGLQESPHRTREDEQARHQADRSARHDDAARAGHDRISVAAMCRPPRARRNLEGTWPYWDVHRTHRTSSRT